VVRLKEEYVGGLAQGDDEQRNTVFIENEPRPLSHGGFDLGHRQVGNAADYHAPFRPAFGPAFALLSQSHSSPGYFRKSRSNCLHCCPPSGQVPLVDREAGSLSWSRYRHNFFLSWNGIYKRKPAIECETSLSR